jgi:hypothetical protein
MLRSLFAVLLACSIAVVPIAALADGTLDLAPDAAWATPLSDNEMGELRGGFNGMSFNIAFTGFITDLGPVEGNFQLEGAEPPTFDLAATDALISTQIGSFSGFNGIAQIQIVPGNFNFVQQNLFIQVVLIDGTTASFSDGVGSLSTPQF